MIKYCSYGNGDKYLIAFHGYGMDGYQFQAISNLCKNYRIISFHLPYHHGIDNHEGWFSQVIAFVTNLIEENSTNKISVLGYSIGSRLALNLSKHFDQLIEEVVLIAPYGIENHWGLRFLTSRTGLKISKYLVANDLPIKIMKLLTRIRLIDEEHLGIVLEEIDTPLKRNNLHKTMQMMSDLSVDVSNMIEVFNSGGIHLTLVYGKYDVLFPFHKRNTRILEKFERYKTHVIDQGHWMQPDQLNQTLSA